MLFFCFNITLIMLKLYFIFGMGRVGFYFQAGVVTYLKDNNQTFAHRKLQFHWK